MEWSKKGLFAFEYSSKQFVIVCDERILLFLIVSGYFLTAFSCHSAIPASEIPTNPHYFPFPLSNSTIIFPNFTPFPNPQSDSSPPS